MAIELSTQQRTRALSAIEAAREFLLSADYPLGTALVDHLGRNERGAKVVEALQAFQNEEGGFGRGLEVDIKAPESNPFATRLAMTAMLAVRDDSVETLKPSLQEWLASNQNDDGDWHLSAATRAGELAPWFAHWQHPSLNPACCVTGLANRLGIATPEMLARTEKLFGAKSSVVDIQTGGFYELLPYVEYIDSGVVVADRSALLDELATAISTRTDEVYADALHFWEQVLAGGPELIDRLPGSLLAERFDALLAEQQPDGGWPTPYDQGWRPWSTTGACLALFQVLGGDSD